MISFFDGIDISSPPPEEIILDLQGREMRQKVKWDRISLYCRECKHVGHAWETCYASGRREKPAKKDYNNHQSKYQFRGHKGNGDKRWQETTYRGESSALNTDTSMVNDHLEKEHFHTNESEHGTLQRPVNVEDTQSDQEGGEFRTQGRRRGRSKKGGSQVAHKPRSNSTDRQGTDSAGVHHGNESLAPRGGGQMTSPITHEQRQREFAVLQQDHIVKPRFYCLTEDGDFDTEHYEDEVDMELENDEEADDDHNRPPDKHGHALVESGVNGDDGKHKKVKLSASTSNLSG